MVSNRLSRVILSVIIWHFWLAAALNFLPQPLCQRLKWHHLPPPNPDILQAEITFELTIPGSTSPQNISVDILDEVTGLALNPARYGLAVKDNSHYTIKLPFPIGSVIKYRYNQMGDAFAVEYNAEGAQVRYRMYSVTGPAVIQDTLFAWQILPIPDLQVLLLVSVRDAQSDQPLSDMLVSIAGEQTWTLSDGTFLLQNVPVGTHQMVIYAIDGTYPTFTQQATIVEGLTTPAVISLPANPIGQCEYHGRYSTGNLWSSLATSREPGSTWKYLCRSFRWDKYHRLSDASVDTLEQYPVHHFTGVASGFRYSIQVHTG